MSNLAIDIDQLPTPKEEAWKYTNLPRAVPDGLTRQEPAAPVTIHKSRGEVSVEPQDLVFTGSGGALLQPSVKITLDAGAQATIVERHVSDPASAGPYWRNMTAHIELGDNARLNHIRLFEDSDDAVNTVTTHITQARDSSYYGFGLLMGGKLVRNQTAVRLEGPGAHCDLSGVSLLRGTQHGDTTIIIDHAAPHCTSSQFFRHVLGDQARGVFQGKVHVHQIAQKTDGYQLSNALLLSDKAEMDTKPELEIYADDVKCSHGSTTGQLDEEALFYLRTRGMHDPEARRLLIKAFVDEASDKIADESLQLRVQGLCQNWLDEVLGARD